MVECETSGLACECHPQYISVARLLFYYHLGVSSLPLMVSVSWLAVSLGWLNMESLKSATSTETLRLAEEKHNLARRSRG
jgi:hypothetical protein